MRRLVISLIVVAPILVVAAGLLWTLGVFKQAEPVEVVEVRLASLHRSISTNGKVEAEKVFDLRAPVAGLCRWAEAREGSRLAAGAPVVRIEDAALQAQKMAAQSELDAALLALRDVERGPATEERSQSEAETARAQLSVDGARQLVQENEWLLARDAISRYEVEQSRKRLAEAEQALKAARQKQDDMLRRYDEQDRRNARSRVEAAQARIRYLADAEARLIVRAPADGTLVQLLIKDGAYLNFGEPIGLFADLERLRLRAYVDEPDLGQVAIGEQVSIRWDAHPQERWNGKVTRLPAQVTELGSRSVAQVLCSIDAPLGMLLPNINVDVEIATQPTTPVKSLPRGIVFPDGSREYVWVVESGKLARRFIRTGRSTSDRIEIVGGLEAGAMVVDPGDALMTEGVKVTVKTK
jgi:HlyD family secretion protein